MASIANTRKLPGVLTALRTHWVAMSGRERRLVILAASIVGLAVMWLALLRPALRTLRTAPGEIAQLQSTLRTAQVQAQELSSLAAAPAVVAQTNDLRGTLGDWLRDHDVQGQVTALPGSVTLNVNHLKPQTLLDLAQVARHDWGATVTQAQLTRGADGSLDGRIQISQQQATASP